MRKILVTLTLLTGALPALAEDTAEELFRSRSCQACHRSDVRLVGPSLQDIAARYTKQDDATSTLAGRIRNGGQGNWGAIPMPPNRVTESEANALARWILQQKP